MSSLFRAVASKPSLSACFSRFSISKVHRSLTDVFHMHRTQIDLFYPVIMPFVDNTPLQRP